MRDPVLLSIVSIAFAFFIMCPRMAGMIAVVARVKNVNPYVATVIGGLIAIPLIMAMVYITMRFGVHIAILAAAATDVLAAVMMGNFKIRYGIEIAIIALFIWIGVITARHIAPYIEELLT